MRSFLSMSLLIIGTLLFANQANAAQIPISKNTISIAESGLVHKVYHRCYPSRCWCRGGRTVCTRDCRRDRHCRWVRSFSNSCGRVWRCTRSVRRPIYRCRRCQRRARIRYRLCLRRAGSYTGHKKCRAIYARDRRRCRRTVCRR